MPHLLNMLYFEKRIKMKNSVYQGLISVIVSTYNWPEALKLVLLSLNNQTDNSFEIIVVDDGSTFETKEMLDQFKLNANFSLKHVWQEDKGFRVARARNAGIKNASGEYVIFFDGDCVLNPFFIEHHRKLAEKNCFVVGHRVILSKRYTQNILKQEIAIWVKNSFYWLIQALKGNVNKFFPKLYIPFLNRHKQPNNWKGAQTCNLAFWRNDLLGVKGFDESFEGWGFEDSDLVIRIINNGKKRKSGKFATEVFHLWHKVAIRSNKEKNNVLLSQLLISERTTSIKSIFH